MSLLLLFNQPASVTTYLSDTFTGTNGASWNSSNWTMQGGTQTIQGNRGEMLTPGSYGNSIIDVVPSIPANFSFTGQVQFPSTDSTLAIEYRNNGTDYYRAFITPSELIIYSTPWPTIVGNTSISTSLTDLVNFRLEVDGTSHKLRFWLNSDPEPSTWNINTTNSVTTATPTVPMRLFFGDPNSVTGYLDNVSITSVGGGGASTSLGLSHITSAATLFAPSINVGSVSLNLSHISSTVNLFEPSINTGGASLALPHISSASVLYSPTINVGGVSLALSHITSSATVYQPTVSITGVNLILPQISSSTIIYQPTVSTGAVNLILPHIASSIAIYQPTVSTTGVNLTLPHISSSTVIYQPAVSVGAVSLTLPQIVSSTAIYQPTVSSAGITLTPPQIASTSNTFTPSIIVGATSIQPPIIGSTNQLYQQLLKLNINLAAISSGATLFAPTVTIGAASINLPSIANVDTLYGPTLTSGAISISAPFINSSSILYNQTVAPGSVNLSIPFISSSKLVENGTPRSTEDESSLESEDGTDLFAGTLLPQPVAVSLPRINSTNISYEPVVIPGSITISPAQIGSISTSYPFKVNYTLYASLIGSTNILYPVNITSGLVYLSMPQITSGVTIYNISLVKRKRKVNGSFSVGVTRNTLNSLDGRTTLVHNKGKLNR